MKRCFGLGVAGFLAGSLLVQTPLVQAQPPGGAAAPPVAALPITLAEIGTTVGGPTLITMHLKDATAQAVLQELTRQAGVPVRLLFSDDALPPQKYTLDIEKQPFWTALLEVCRQLQLAPQLAGDRNIQDLLPGNPDDATGALIPINPLMTLTAREMRHEHSFSLKNANGALQAQQDTHSIYFNGWALVDPKIHVAPNTTVNVDITEAVDEKGQELPHEQGGASFVQSPALWDLQLNLGGRADAGKTLASLKGIIKAFVVSKNEKWEVADLANAGPTTKTVKTPQGNETYRLVDLAQNGKQYEVTIGVTRPAQAEPAPDEDVNIQQLRTARQDLGSFTRLLDAQGRDIPYISSKIDGEAITLTFGRQEGENAAGAPNRLVLDIPVEFRELQIPFEFKNVPLP